MKFKHLILAVIALGVISCKKETSDPRLSDGYFEVTAQSVIEVVNTYNNASLELTLLSGESWKFGYLVSDYMVVRCKTSNCVYVVNGTLYTSTRTFYPPTK